MNLKDAHILLSRGKQKFCNRQTFALSFGFPYQGEGWYVLKEQKKTLFVSFVSEGRRAIMESPACPEIISVTIWESEDAIFAMQCVANAFVVTSDLG